MIIEIIKLVIQKTKRLLTGAAFIVLLVEERDLLMTEFRLLNSISFFKRKLNKQETEFKPKKTNLLGTCTRR